MAVHTFDTHDTVYECTVKWKNESPSPFGVFSVPSASWRKVFPSISITKLSAETVSIRFEGDTWSFKTQFSQCGIHGRFENSDGQVVPLNGNSRREEERCSFMFGSLSPSTYRYELCVAIGFVPATL